MFFSKKVKKEIELLPEAEGSAEATKVKFIIGAGAALVIILLLVVAAATFVLNSAENRQSKQLSEQLDSKIAAWQKFADTAQDVSLTKAKVGELQKITGANEIYLASLEKIRSSVPAGVTLISFAMKKSASLTIQASAAGPTSLYQFVEQLRGQKDFVTQITISSLAKSGDKYLLNLSLAIKSQ